MADKREIHSTEEYFSLTLTEVCHSFGVKSETIITIVDEGIITPEGDNEQSWQFDNKAMQKIRMALQLHHDLGVNFAGAGLAMELIKEIDRLHALIKKQSDE